MFIKLIEFRHEVLLSGQYSVVLAAVRSGQYSVVLAAVRSGQYSVVLAAVRSDSLFAACKAIFEIICSSA
jgi:DNA gyrase inhibitor GyrI